MTTSLFHSFDEPLPRADSSGSSDTGQAKCSSTIVQEEDPPRILIADDISTYMSLANSFLRQNSTLIANKAGPEPVPDIVLDNEDDVKANVRSLLLDPIIRAISVDHRYSEKVIIVGERQLGALRVDVGIVYKPKGKNQPAMMVEYNPANIIEKELFEEMAWDMSDLDQNTFLPNIPNTDKEIKKEYSATKQLKRVKALASQGNCKYVALCDWFSLIFIKFSDDLTVAYTTAVKEKDFRKATLGFLLAALHG